jgi:hypothetical protein
MKKFNRNSYSLILTSFILTSCGARSNNGNVSVDIDLGAVKSRSQVSSSKSLERLFASPMLAAGPSDVGSFDCFMVNVYGPQIPATDHSMVTATCSYQGITSPLVPPSQTTLSIQLPSGPSRTFQVLGVETGSGCGSATTVQTLKSSNANVNLYTLGQTTADIFSDTTLNIQDTYSAANPVAPYTCLAAASTTGIPLTLIAGVTGTNITATSLAPAPLVSLSTSFSNSVPVDTAAQIGDLSQTSNTTPLMYDLLGNSSNRVSREDFVFSLDGFILSNYSRVRIVAMAGGSNYPNPASGPGATLSLWNTSSSAWITLGSNTSPSYPNAGGGSYSPSEFSAIDQTFGISPSSVAISTSTLTSDGYNNLTSNQNLYVTVTGNNNSNTGDTNVGVVYIQAFLLP